MEMRSESMPAGDLRLIPPGSRSGSVGIPSSKSVAHRALICAAVGENPVSVLLDGLSEDILATPCPAAIIPPLYATDPKALPDAAIITEARGM